jgi:hypothetical protein
MCIPLRLKAFAHAAPNPLEAPRINAHPEDVGNSVSTPVVIAAPLLQPARIGASEQNKSYVRQRLEA